MEERCLHRLWVLSHKRNAEPASFTTVFDKSNSAPGHLKNVWGHSILFIKISQRHSLKYLQKVIVDGGKTAVSKVRKTPILRNTAKRRCLQISEDWLQQLLDKLKKAQLLGIKLDETTDVSEEVPLILCCRFANYETKTIGGLCCLKRGSLLHHSSHLRQIEWDHWKTWIWLDKVLVSCYQRNSSHATHTN